MWLLGEIVIGLLELIAYCFSGEATDRMKERKRQRQQRKNNRNAKKQEHIK